MYIFFFIKETSQKNKNGVAIREKNIIKDKQFKRPPERYTAYLNHLKKINSFKIF